MKPYYEDGLVSIFHADAREVTATMERGSIDFIFTDPPYGHNNNSESDLIGNWERACGLLAPGQERPGYREIDNDGVEADELVEWLFTEARRLLVPGGCICCCCAGGGGPNPAFVRWGAMLDKAMDFKHAVVWDKGGLGMGWHYRRNYEFVLVGEKPGAACRWFGGREVANIIRINGLRPGPETHPTPKPIGLAARFLDFHTLPGHLVLDPFMGGGSTLVAAKQGGRRAIGCDADERWCELTARNLSQASLFEMAEAPAAYDASGFFALDAPE